MSEWDRKHWEKKPVTLPRVWGIESGTGYVTVPFAQEEDGRGEHMRLLIKRRRKQYGSGVGYRSPDDGLLRGSCLHRDDGGGDRPSAEDAEAA